MLDIWTPLITSAERYLGLSPVMSMRVIQTILAVVGYFAMRTFFSLLFGHRVGDLSRRYLYKKTANYSLSFALIVCMVFVWFGKVGGLAAYLGIVSAGLAIALQDPLTNFAGWIFLSARKPFGVGDRIQIGDHAGDVIDIRIFQFTVAEIGNWVDADQSTGRIIHIPNGWVFKQSVSNYAQGFSFIWNELPITITFESDWEKAKEILSEIAANRSVVRSQHAQNEVRKAARRFMIYFQHLTPIVWTSVADHGVTLTIRYICEPRARRVSEAVIWEDVLRAFGEANDIDLAYPTTRFYNNVSEGKSEARAPSLHPVAPE